MSDLTIRELMEQLEKGEREVLMKSFVSKFPTNNGDRKNNIFHKETEGILQSMRKRRIKIVWPSSVLMQCLCRYLQTLCYNNGV